MGESQSEIQVLQSVDGGETWSVLSTPEDSGTSLAFADRRNGWRAGVSALARTRDGGRIWENQLSNVPDDVRVAWLTDVLFLDEHHGVAAGADRNPELPFGDVPSLILRTNDGGERWHRAEILGESAALRRAILFSICLTPEGLGLAAGDGVSGVVVLRSIDGGESWAEVTANLPAPEGRLACFGDRYLWVGAGSDSEGRPRILGSSNAGMDWERQTVARGVEGSVNAIVFLDTDRGWAVGHDSRSQGPLILRTLDGGRLWEAEDVPDVGPGSSGLGAISMLPSGEAVAVGSTSQDANQRPLALFRAAEDAEWRLSLLPPDLLFLSDAVLLP